MTENSLDVWLRATSNWSHLALDMGSSEVQVPGGLLHYYGVELTSTFCNFVHVQNPEIFSLKRVEEEFANRKLPFTVKIPRHHKFSKIENSLHSSGYSLVPVWGIMIYEAGKAERNSGVKVELSTSSQFSEWTAISPEATLQRKTQQEMNRRLIENKSALMLLAMIDGRPVGRGLLYLKERVASIHMMATLPEFRRRHVATTVVMEALEQLKNQAVDMIWLRTRKNGVGEKVYLKIGFKPQVDILTYSLTPHLDQALAAKH